MATKSAPHSEQKPLVISRKMTLHRKACSLVLLIGGMASSFKNGKTYAETIQYGQQKVTMKTFQVNDTVGEIVGDRPALSRILGAGIRWGGLA